MSLRTDIGDRKAVDHDVHDVVDDYDEPCRQPRRRILVKSGLSALVPGRTAGPRSILDPRDVSRQVPAINDEMGATDHSERGGILRDKQKRQEIEQAMYQRWQRTFSFLNSHPLALQYIVADGVGNYLINGEHEDRTVTPSIRESVVAIERLGFATWKPAAHIMAVSRVKQSATAPGDLLLKARICASANTK